MYRLRSLYTRSTNAYAPIHRRGAGSYGLNPPPDEAQRLYELARQGAIVEFRERLDALERRGAEYRICVAELRQLARRYRLRQICAVLEPYV